MYFFNNDNEYLVNIRIWETKIKCLRFMQKELNYGNLIFQLSDYLAGRDFNKVDPIIP